MDLINALRTLPLRVLSIEGISYAGLDLIDRLAEAFPDLEALTLVRRENGETKQSVWPHASWEYAHRLAQFQHLEYFAWNFRINAATPWRIWDTSLCASGFPQPPDSYEEDDLEFTQFEGLRWMTLFLAYCKTLRTIVFMPKILYLPIVPFSPREDEDIDLAAYGRDPDTQMAKYNPEAVPGRHPWFF
ncbi:hypothetical protein CERSUDRAFT_86767 [Gelatoporia subvermispora B]|uniref:Uncharacterized protein n=1 Tax=Ceriporiopsis subvermispora (strain B) TaxID=914234 RepID=M2R530_CERS8|nr:hypothetical protein CERSUDRAFT_86767 [Gelatoporia subvermispora B]